MAPFHAPFTHIPNTLAIPILHLLSILPYLLFVAYNNNLWLYSQDRAVYADSARANFFRPGGDHLTLLSVYNEVCVPCSNSRDV